MSNASDLLATPRPPAPNALAITMAQYATIAAAVLAGTFVPVYGTRYLITDGLMAGRFLEWNGESFGGFFAQPIMQSFAAVTRSSANAAGDATYAVLQSMSIPGYLMRPNSKLRIVTDWAFTNSAALHYLQVKYNGTDVAAPNYATPNVAQKILTEVLGFNSYTAQRVHNSVSFGATNNAQITASAETRAPVTLEIGCRWGAAAASEVITLLGYSIELVP